MSSLREFRRKISSVKKTQQITRAMKMVATARLRRAQASILSARPFAQRMEELLRDLAGRLEQEGKNGDGSPFTTKWRKREPSPFLSLLEQQRDGEEVLVLVTADKGLCGAFSANLIRKGMEFLEMREKQTVYLFLVGRKGRDFFRRLHYPVVKEYVNVFTKLGFIHAELLGEDLIQLYLEKPIRKVSVLYQVFVSAIQQRLTLETLLPIAPPHPSPLPPKGGEGRVRGETTDYLYEPKKEELLKALLPRYLKARLYRILMESYAAELAARMNAMENATQNAGEIIEGLTLQANKTRQAMITKEIAELVGSAEALA